MLAVADAKDDAPPPGGYAVFYPRRHSMCWFGALLDEKGA